MGQPTQVRIKEAMDSYADLMRTRTVSVARKDSIDVDAAYLRGEYHRRRTGLGTSLAVAAAVVAITAAAIGIHAGAHDAPAAPLSAIPPASASGNPSYDIIAASQEIVWDGSILKPLPASAQHGLVSADTAFAQASRDPLLTQAVRAQMIGKWTAGLYAYSDPDFGTVQRDGSIKQQYNATPVWVFAVHLRKYVDLTPASGGHTVPAQPNPHPSASSTTPEPTYSTLSSASRDCSYLTVLSATDATALTTGLRCAS